MTDPGRPTTPNARVVAFAASHAPLVAALGIALGLAAILYSLTHFAMNTNADALLSSKLAYREREAAFEKLFPNNDPQMLVVIDAATPELAQQAADGLAAKLQAQPQLFTSVDQAGGGTFFRREGLLFQPIADVQAYMQQLIEAEPFLGPLAADPSLRGLMSPLSSALQGVNAGQAQLASLSRPMASLADALEKLERGQPAYFSWRALMGPVDRRELRQVLLVDPKLDFTRLKPAEAASAAIRADAAALGFDAAHGVRVRLTGPAPLQDEEFGSLAERALPITVVALGAIVLMLWLAVRSRRVIAAILISTLAGLAISAAFGLVVFGAFNVISIAFIPLFVGLGIDFGIQLSVRYRAEHLAGIERGVALIAAAERMGQPLTLAACAIAAGFLAFAPTAYVGVSQLGLIAGAGMIVALLLTLTLLPALIVLMKPRDTQPGPPPPRITQLDDLIISHRRRVVTSALIAAAASIALLPFLHFDFNPLHLRDAKTESVATLLDLTSDPAYSPNTLEVVRRDLPTAEALAAQVKRLPEVADARTLADFVPTDQPAKLAAIKDASDLLSITLNPFVTAPPPTDSEVIQSLDATAAALRQTAGSAADPAASQARRLAAALERLASGPAPLRAKAADMLVTPFNTLLGQIQNVLAAEPVTLQSLPPDIRDDWVAPNGRARVSILPSGDANNTRVLAHFIDTLVKAAPGVTGAPIGIREGGRTVVTAFIEAGVLSFVAITLLLFLVLHRVRDVAITMAPIVLTGLLTLGSCVVIGQPINFANIIALPLLFGIGVAFHIYFVMSWRTGGSHLLTSSLARAVFFSALTTATGFGSLWLSSHPGTASMGKLLMISLVWTLVSALIFQPALMGPPRRAPAQQS